ncbi:NADAR family protein [Acidithiobacillus ferrooxidans]|uniref:NADAR family protein n=1 Tax=Acidithiobacillus ferrooxidans TaxID=920 RepID=UPI001C0777D7|nr:NADAR family protein [Acidithiobacillus ferrooxidans]MBU2772523.1 NADAR family protein [Acidithiobacillus ferrooxidans]
MDEIRFYRANEKPYGAFSNLYKRKLEFEGAIFPTAEHAYQAGKARKLVVREWLMAAPSPSLLAMAAHGLYAWDVASDWSKIKFDRMKLILKAKFTQHDDLQALLLSTGNARLVESATADNAVNRLWGEVNGVGQNKLGQLLMEVRSEILMTQEKAEHKVNVRSHTTTLTAPATRSECRTAGQTAGI